jgi:hypothetical protein
MRIPRYFPGPALAAVAAACFAHAAAFAQSTESPNVKTGPSYAEFMNLRKQCETEVPLGKAHGDVCARAASMLLVGEPPEVYRDLSVTQRTKIALRLLEKGVDSSDIAASRAYDLYNLDDITGYGVADAFRAKELMELMLKRGYPGATLRIAVLKVPFYNLNASAAEKTEACQTAKKLLAGGKLDGDSLPLANEILASGYCKSLAEAQSQPK